MMDEPRPSTASPQPVGEPPVLDAGRFGARGPWRHWALWLILAILALHSLRTFDTYLVSDDLKWVQRSAADASHPWNTFVEPLFGDYYRPMPHLMWLANYYIWGFNFRGYQLMFIALWLGIVALVYTVGSRLGGRGAGATAAALVGFHGVYLMIASWKSWYTTTTELAAVLACIRCLCEWVDTRERRWLAWTVATGIVAMLSRELAPLVISAAVFATVVLPVFDEGRERRRAAWLGAAAWAAVTAAVLMALPSYRHMAFGALAAKTAAATPAPVEGGPGIGNFLGHFRTHTQSIFFGGVWAWLLLTALVWEIGARLKPGASDEATPVAARNRRELFIVGAFVLGAVLLALPLGAVALGESAQRNAELFVLPAVHGLLLLFFLATAWTGDRWDRMLALWFMVAFAPILVLEHGSGAYHMLAYTALALYAARTLWRRATPDALEFLRDWRGALRACDARTAVCGVLVVAAAGQFYVLARNLSDVGGALDDRARHGRAMEQAVDTTVAALRQTASDAHAFTANEPYSELAGLILQKQHGFAVEPLGERVGLRRADLPLQVYSSAVAYNDGLFRRCNVFPDPSFEQAAGGIPTAEPGRSGRRAAVSSAQGESRRNCVLDLGPFGLKPGAAVVFGGFLRVEGEQGGSAGMALRSEKEASGRYLVRTQRVAAPQAEWRLVWACAAPPGDERYFLRVIDGEKLRNVRVMADDVFMCPVETLMAGERR